MTVTRDDAQQTLREMTQTVRRSSAAYSYYQSAPHLLLWGVIWVVGYGLSYWRPQLWELWPILCAAGIAGSVTIGMRMKAHQGAVRDLRPIATVVAVTLLIGALFAILPAYAIGRSAGAFFPLLVAFYYALIGIWAHAVRMLILGVALAALTLAAFFLIPGFFPLWMAIVGGGGLILGGLWLRSA
jgi:hypothetical protein